MRFHLKDLLPRTLLWRSLFIIFTPMILVQAVSAYVFYNTHWDTVTRRLAHGVAGDIAAVIEIMRALPPGDHAALFDMVRQTMDLRFAMDDGGILPNVPNTDPADDQLEEALRQRVRRPYLIDWRGRDREVAISVQLSQGVLTVMAPRKRLYSFTSYIFVLWMAGSAMLLLGIATIFMRNQVRSVRRLAAAADSLGKGREVDTFKAEGAAEVRQAASAFNLMRERIKRQLQQRTEMLAGVSHDLRTPLTRMKLQLAMMDAADGIAELNQDVAEMEVMIEGYLAFARGEGSEKAVDTDLVALVEDVVGRFRRNGAAVDLHCEDDVGLPLRPHAMGRCLSNLISNAQRYAGHVAVRVGRRGDAVEILVDDDGPGIPPSRRDDVFKPFFRLESSRNPKTGGVGLGLTIARDVVRSHGGELTLEDSPLGGLRTRLRLPL